MVMERVERGVNLHDWLRDGRIDGLITYNAELIHFLGDSRVKRLFPNAAQDERDWWPRTHLMPMMNVIACTEETLKNRPAETRAVFDAFVQAKEMGLKAVLNNRTSGLVWYWQAVEDQLLILGRDPIPYSVEKNRPAMEALFSYCVEQGLVDRKLDVDDLFFSGFDS
jgi:4,5-dihydroxyphthalate decarboxylase